MLSHCIGPGWAHHARNGLQRAAPSIDLWAARYSAWDSDLGREVMAGERSLADLHRPVAAGETDPAPRSGGQEALENLVNRYIERVR